MSGESLRVMILRVESMLTVVLNGGRSSKLCQPSAKATRASGSGRPVAFDGAPRPRRRSPSTATSASVGALRSTAAGRGFALSRDGAGRRAKPPAGAGGLGQEDVGAGGRLTAAYERAMGRS